MGDKKTIVAESRIPLWVLATAHKANNDCRTIGTLIRNALEEYSRTLVDNGYVEKMSEEECETYWNSLNFSQSSRSRKTRKLELKQRIQSQTNTLENFDKEASIAAKAAAKLQDDALKHHNQLTQQ